MGKNQILVPPYSLHVIFNLRGQTLTTVVRRRFTAAHEIAHFILHRNKIGDSISDDEWYRSGLSNPEEVEANRFAARLLMPDHLLKQCAPVWNFDKGVLAKLFEVSEEAMAIRLKGL